MRPTTVRNISLSVLMLASVFFQTAQAVPVLRGVVVTPGSGQTLTESANDSFITDNDASTLIDSNLATWDVQSGVVYKNGATAGFSAQVVLLLIHSHVIYQTNSSGGWWSWSGTDWVSEAGDPRGAVPVINSSPSVSGTVGVSFSYTITASNSPTSFSHTGTLPSGVTRTGAVISGTPSTTSGSPFTVTLTAVNGTGTSAPFTLTIIINPVTPVGNRVVGSHWMGTLSKNTGGNSADVAERSIVMNEMANDAAIDFLGIFWDGDTTNGQPSGEPIDDANDRALAAAIATGTKMTTVPYGFRYSDSVHLGSGSGVFKDANGRVVLNSYNCYLDLHNPGGVYENRGNLNDLKSHVNFNLWVDPPFCATQTRAQRVSMMAANSGQPCAVAVWFLTPQTPFGGGVYDIDDWVTEMDSIMTDATTWNVPVVPPINVNYVSQPNKNYLMFASEGFRDLKRQYDWAMSKTPAQVPGIQIITIDDFNEHHYWQTFGDGSSIVGGPGHEYWSPTLVLDHSGFRKFGKRYHIWFKTGVEPAVTTNEFLLSYRLHPRTASSYVNLSTTDKNTIKSAWLGSGMSESYFETDFQNTTHAIFSDTIQACVRLKSSDLPATATLSCGSATPVTVTCTTAETILVMNGANSSTVNGRTRYTFSTGQYATPHLTVTRNNDSATLKSANGPVAIWAFIVPGGFNQLAVEL